MAQEESIWRQSWRGYEGLHQLLEGLEAPPADARAVYGYRNLLAVYNVMDRNRDAIIERVVEEAALYPARTTEKRARKAQLQRDIERVAQLLRERGDSLKRMAAQIDSLAIHAGVQADLEAGD